MNRRDFLRGASLTSLGLAIAAEEIAEAQAKKPAKPPIKNTAAQKPADKPATATTTSPNSAAPAVAKLDDELKGRPVTCAVIGLGPRGKEILTNLASMTDRFAPVAAICDKFTAPVFVKKAQVIAPKARFEADYRKVLDDKTIDAIFIATPTHLHRQIALDAIAAGKHVYCEAPLSNDIAEAKTIAQAAMAATSIFQPGLQARCNLQTEHIHHFILSKAPGEMTTGRGQWHRTTTWRQANPNSEREAELNWRLNRETSTGLLGEIGIHQIDTASWFYKGLPVAITGFGGIMQHKDGRSVFDTVQAVVEYPNDLRFMYDATLTSSFDDAYELFTGTDATIMLRDQRGWMFKEATAGQLGWEVFARKDSMQIGKPELGSGISIGNGIALVADASKQLALGKTELTNDPTKNALYYALRAFLNGVRAGQRVPVREPSRDNAKPPLIPSALEGYQATVVAIKANEAALAGNRVVIDKDLYTL